MGLWTLAYVGIEYGVVDLQREYERQYGKDSALAWTRSIAGGIAGVSVASGASLLCEISYLDCIWSHTHQPPLSLL